MAEEIINLIPEEKLKSRIAEKFPNINNLNCRIYLARYSHKMKGAKEWDKFIDVQINFDEDIDNLKEILSYSKTIAEEAIKKYFEKRN
jgi:coenzyme F420-reducing hydrogenase alpha subunit